MATFNETAHSIFLEAWNNLPKISYNSEWENGTGYLDFITTDESLILNKHQIVGCTDPSDRKMLVKGLGNGLNMVIFERNPKGKHGILVANLPSNRKLKNNTFQFPRGAFSSSLNINTIKAFLYEQEHTVRFHLEGVESVLKEANQYTPINLISDLVKDIEEEKDITVSRLNSLGIDVNTFNVYFQIKQYN